MGETTKVISFMWDPYFTCKDTGTALKTQMTSGFEAPIVTGATADRAAGLVIITGFNLSGGDATLKWTSSDGVSHERKTKPLGTEEKYGEERGLNPKLESVTLDLGDSALVPGISYIINVTNRWNVGLNTEFADVVFAP